MRFDSSLRPWLAVSADETRPHICNVMLDVANKVMVATNGHILVTVPCDPSATDKAGLLSPDALKWAAEHDERGYVELDCSSDTECTAVESGVKFPRPDAELAAKFPPWKLSMPAFGDKPTHVFSLDANLLLKLANALGAGAPRKDRQAIIILTVAGQGEVVDAMEVKSSGIGAVGAVGALMPCRV